MKDLDADEYRVLKIVACPETTWIHMKQGDYLSICRGLHRRGLLTCTKFEKDNRPVELYEITHLGETAIRIYEAQHEGDPAPEAARVLGVESR